MKENMLLDRILQVYQESTKNLSDINVQPEKKESSEEDINSNYSSAVPEIDGNYLLYFNEIYTTPIRKFLKRVLKKLTWSILKRQVYFNSVVRKILYELIQKNYEQSIKEKDFSQRLAQLQERIEQLSQIEHKLENLPQLQETKKQLIKVEQKIEILPSLQERIEELTQLEQKLEQKIEQTIEQKIKQKVEQKIEVLPELQQKIENLNTELQASKDIAIKFSSTEEAKISSGLWFNEPIIVGYRKDNEAYWAGTNERVFEKAFVLQSLARLYKSSKVELLDVGAAESLLSYQLASLNYSVTAIDIRPIALFHPNLKFVKTDICKPSLAVESFDCVIALSTLEHIGLGWYGDESGETLDIEAVKQIHSLLKPEGSFILTVPYGKKACTPVHRIYDKTSLENLIEDFDISEIHYGIRKDDFTWVTVEDEIEASTKEHNPENYLPGAVAMVICKKTSK